MKSAWVVLLSGLCLVACGGRRAAAPSPLADSTRLGVHGMVVFGEGGAYLYHLPMWHGLHAWQIVIEARMDAAGRQLHDADRAAGGTLVTFEPEPFALAALAPGFEMKGRLYHGHFEQGGTPLPSADAAAWVTFTVQRLLLVEPLRSSDPKPASAEYRFFGRGGEGFGIHVAHGAPDFDHILRLEATAPVPGGRTWGGVLQTTGRPAPGNAWTGRLTDGTALPVTVTREEYFSTTDLGAAP